MVNLNPPVVLLLRLIGSQGASHSTDLPRKKLMTFSHKPDVPALDSTTAHSAQ